MRNSGSTFDIELWAYRALCLLGGLALPLSAFLFGRSNAAWVDPLWLRLVVGALPLIVFVASFLSEQVRRELSGLTTVLLYVLVIWFAGVALVNGLPPEYAVGGLALIVAVGVVSGAGQARLWSLGVALATTAAAMVFVAYVVADPGVDRAIFSGAIVASAAVLYVGTWVQRRLRRQLLASEERYRTIFERVADGVALADPDTLRIFASNVAYRRITGFRSQEITTRNLEDLLVLRPEELDSHVRQALEEGSADLGECKHLRRDGSRVDVAIGLSRIPDDDRELLCITMRDLSEQNQVRAEIERARDQAQAMLELRTAFLNNMSHEIRTPLVSLTGFLSIMEEEQAHIDPVERADMIASLRRSADRLNETLNAVLDLAQIESGHHELEMEPVDINAAAEDAARLISASAREKGLSVHVQPTEPARVLVDRNALHRILVNLFTNAVKFTPSGAVTIAAEADSHRVLLHVRDTGVGMDPEFVPHLFGAFRQESTGLAREHEGSGLGLTIVKRLLDLMGGRIRVHSEPGEGTCVTLIFARTWAAPGRENGPVDIARHAGSDGAAAPAEPAWSSSATIEPLAPRARALIVEDNADTARLMHRMLRDSLDVDVVHSGEAALERAQSAWYDLLVVDIHLGAGIDGTVLLSRLRAMSAYAHVPAVAVTAAALQEDRKRFQAVGFDAYLSKPFTRAQLLKSAEEAHAARAAASA